jgi:hypothetical protein
LKAAEELARSIRTWLHGHGFPLSVTALSGNGYHLLLLIDLPAKDDELIKRCLLALDQVFSTAAVSVDTGVFNAARITKCYGTWARKDDGTDERPNRQSRLIDVPDDLQVVPRERLEWLASQYVEPEQPDSVTSSNGRGADGRFSIKRYLSRTGAKILKEETGRDGTRRIFITCPGIDSHTTRNADRDCVVFQHSDGKLGAKCFHASCGITSWATFRAKNGPVTSEDFDRPDNSDVDLAGIVGNCQENQKSGPAGRETPKTQAEYRGKMYSSPQGFESFPLGILPKALREFVEHHARLICCDPTLVLLPSLAVMATAIGNSRRVVIRKSWFEPSILWTVTVADSGSGKSPAFDAARYPLTVLQKNAFQIYEGELAEYKLLKRQFDQQQRSKKGLIESIPEPVLPELQNIFLEDTTVEAIAPALHARPRGSAIIREELSGWFGSHNAYKQQAGSDEAFYLQAHGGRSAKVNRKGSKTIFIPSASLSVTGTIQGGVLKKVLSRTHIDSGMSARICYAMPNEFVRRWSEEEIPGHVIENYNNMVYRLATLPMDTDAFDEPQPVYLGMSAAAKDRFRTFYDEIGAIRPGIETTEMKAAWSKLEGGAARLALIFGCARFATGEKEEETVDDCDMEAGIIASRWFAREAERIYLMLVETDHESEVRKLIELIQSNGGSILPCELGQKRKKYRGAGEADTALDSLVKLGAGTWTPTVTSESGGRPARTFILNPTGGIHQTQ